ncbi:hypothetical protein TWF694_005943 [Orbilia ellipsospora]|uniref:Uncharacterized protein n=1 Tax=Orbilia ellipsospora TaxID=2528407 RepID=A0AAV9WSD1_9PEZI
MHIRSSSFVDPICNAAQPTYSRRTVDDGRAFTESIRWPAIAVYRGHGHLTFILHAQQHGIEYTRMDHSCRLRIHTDSLQLRDPEKKLHVHFTAAVLAKLPHKIWAIEKQWQLLAVEAPQNLLLDIKLLWKSEPLRGEWSSLTESLGKALTKTKLWEQLGFAPSLQIPSHDRINIILNSKNHTALPPGLSLPTSNIFAISWTFDFKPYSRTRIVELQLHHIHSLVDDCISSFLNNKLGAQGVTGGLLVPGVLQQIRSSMAAMEAITSTLARYAAQCDDYSKFRMKIKQFKAKVRSVGPAVGIASDLPNVIKNQIYYQIFRAIQSARLKKKYCFESASDAETELLSQPLERFQDLFERTGSLIFSQDSETRYADESSEFEDLFDEEDNYSDFEDLLEETKGMNVEESGDEMTPDTPRAPSPIIPPLIFDSHYFRASQFIQYDDDMVSEFSDSDVALFDEKFANSVSAHEIPAPGSDAGDSDYDDCFVKSTTFLSNSPQSHLAESVASVNEHQQGIAFQASEETTQMLF